MRQVGSFTHWIDLVASVANQLDQHDVIAVHRQGDVEGSIGPALHYTIGLRLIAREEIQMPDLVTGKVGLIPYFEDWGTNSEDGRMSAERRRIACRISQRNSSSARWNHLRRSGRPSPSWPWW